MRTLAQQYHDHWKEWSPARRRAEVALKKAIERANQRRDKAYEKAQRMMKDADVRHRAERQAALSRYAEGE